MNVLNLMRQWQEQRDAIPTEKIKVLRLLEGAGSVRRYSRDVENSFGEAGAVKPRSLERAERRIGISGPAMLIGTHGRLGVERATMQNVSSRGVRVIAASEWYADDTILVSLPDGHFTSAARVAYCDALAPGQFAIGLEFVGSGASFDLRLLGPQ